MLAKNLHDKVCQWLATGRWFSLDPSTNKTDHHDITKILLRVTLFTSNTLITVYFKTCMKMSLYM